MTEHGNQPHLGETDEGAGAGGPQPGNDNGERSTGGILAALEGVLVDFQRLMDGRSREDLQRPAQDGGWGVVEILPHLLDWEQIVHERVERILAEDRPELEEYDDSLWAIEHEYGAQDPHQVFRRFSELRRELVARLRELDDAAWQRTAVLGRRGDITLQQMMNGIVDHDAKHLAQARDVIG